MIPVVHNHLESGFRQYPFETVPPSSGGPRHPLGGVYERAGNHRADLQLTSDRNN